MNPLLSLLCMLAGQRTSLDGCHSFLASLMATPPLPFLTSTLHDRSRPSNSGVLMVKAPGPASRRGSHVYEINTWMWTFGRPLPRAGGLSVAKTEMICRQSRSETSRRVWETLQARKLKKYDKYIPGLYLANTTADSAE